MIIFQAAGSGHTGAFGIKRPLLHDAKAWSTTFRSNDYIHRLNRTLQSEMRAISAYRTGGEQPYFEACADHHQKAGKELVRLIIANRGLPEDRTALSLGLTRTLIQICTALPSRLTQRVTSGTLRQLERNLAGNYTRLLKMAPRCDQFVLQSLLRQAQRLAASPDDVAQQP